MSIKKTMYKYQDIERKWQNIWLKEDAPKSSNNSYILKLKKKYYILDMFPYPSASGLHVGHPRGYTITDVLTRVKQMQGFNVLHPMGWDAFGLPAERAAYRSRINPAVLTNTNIAAFKSQIKKLGYNYNWDREICTSDKNYYKWTQWIFVQLYKKGLAYKKKYLLIGVLR